MYEYIYINTNLINGKYIGQHKSEVFVKEKFND